MKDIIQENIWELKEGIGLEVEIGNVGWNGIGSGNMNKKLEDNQINEKGLIFFSQKEIKVEKGINV